MKRREEPSKGFSEEFDRILRSAAIAASILAFIWIVIPGLYLIWRTS